MCPSPASVFSHVSHKFNKYAQDGLASGHVTDVITQAGS